jgi:hypothetical protein
VDLQDIQVQVEQAALAQPQLVEALIQQRQQLVAMQLVMVLVEVEAEALQMETQLLLKTQLFVTVAQVVLVMYFFITRINYVRNA